VLLKPERPAFSGNPFALAGSAGTWYRVCGRPAHRDCAGLASRLAAFVRWLADQHSHRRRLPWFGLHRRLRWLFNWGSGSPVKAQLCLVPFKVASMAAGIASDRPRSSDPALASSWMMRRWRRCPGTGRKPNLRLSVQDGEGDTVKIMMLPDPGARRPAFVRARRWPVLNKNLRAASYSAKQCSA